MEKNSKIYVAGHRGLVGSAIVNNLKSKGYINIIVKTHVELDLRNQAQVEKFFSEQKPEYVFLAAATVGGIVANNQYRAEFIYDNLMIQSNVIHQSYLHGIKKLLFLGSTCIYPRECPQPMREDALLTSMLEYTNEPYAVSKIAGIKMCESYNIQYGTNFISAMPTNLYGPMDNYNLEKSHVLPALIRKMHLAKFLSEGKTQAIIKDLAVTSLASAQEILIKHRVSAEVVEIWGSGKPRREFLYSEEMADACVFIMENRDFKDTYGANEKEIRNTHINIGTGEDISIFDLAELVKKIVGYKGSFIFNINKPDGTMKKMTSVEKLHSLGWSHKISLPEGIEKAYRWYLDSTT
jgi:GDP-L-fucose synthase